MNCKHFFFVETCEFYLIWVDSAGRTQGKKKKALSDCVIDKIDKGSCSTNLGLIETL